MMRILLSVFCLMLMQGSPVIAASKLPLPDGMTGADVQKRMKSECAASSTSENCRRFSRVYHCRVNYSTIPCRKEREHYYCNDPKYKDQKRCDRLRELNGSAGAHHDRGAPVSVGQQQQNTTPASGNSKYNQQQQGSIALCKLTGSCGGVNGASSGGGFGGSSGGLSSGGGSGVSSSGSYSVTPAKICIAPTSCNQSVTPGNLQSALNSANCGCTLTMGSGNYGSFTYSKNCSASSPIILKASGSGVRMSGFNINGSGLIVTGPEVTGQVKINGDFNRITRTAFTGNAEIDFIEGSQNNRIDHNDIVVNRQGVGETSTFIAFYRPRSTAQMYQNNRIDSNYFTTNTPTPSASVTGSAIFLCMYGAQNGAEDMWNYGSSKTLIENNLFENWGRKNVMESKCSDNVFRNNTLVNAGRVLNRHNGRNLYENNWFENITTGLAVREYDNRIIGNVFQKAKIILYGGSRNYPEGECFQKRVWMPAGYDAPQGPPAVRTVIENNIGDIVMGDIEGSGCEVPVLQTRILSHSGSIQKISEVGTTGPTSTNVNPGAKKLSRSQVGRGAPEAGCN